MSAVTVTDRIYLRDAQCRAFDAVVVAVEDGGRVALDATAFYATGGGQPHDTGTLAWEGGSAAVTDVRGHGPVVWHTLEGDVPAVGGSGAGDAGLGAALRVDAHAHGAAHPVRGDLQHVGERR